MTETATQTKPDLIATATEIAAAYVSRNHVAAADLPSLIVHIHATLTTLSSQGSMAGPEDVGEPKPSPSEIRKSITPDALISFIDGKPYKTLKRHLTKYGLEAYGYRAKYGLPADYPMTAVSYSKRRSTLAHSIGLGRKKHGPAKSET